MTFYATCKECSSTIPFQADSKDLVDFRVRGKKIQDAMPYLKADERELLVSGICGKCFDEIFRAE